MRRTKDDMLIFTIGKKGYIPFNPGIGVSYATGRAKPGFTGMGNFLFFLAGWALVQMESHFLSTTFDDFINVANNTRADSPRVFFHKIIKMIREYLFDDLFSP